ncbi:MAG: TIGR02449 family protein [Gammaproteobacteria bacterium]
MNEDSFQNLSSKVDDLIDLCAQMKRENQLLKANESTWQTERQKLLEKNKETKTKLESILVRLKAMDQT